MSARSAYLHEEAGLNACYGKSFQKHDEDCIECDVQSDCESLTALRRQRGKTAVAKKKPVQVVEVEEEYEDTEEETQEELYRRWAMPWGMPVPKKPKKKKAVNAYPYPPQAYGIPPFPPQHPYYYEPSTVYNPYFPTDLRYPPPVPVRPHPSVEQYRRDMQLMQAMGCQPPGTHQTTYAIEHPTSPHLSYVFGNPVYYPMPRPGESFIIRLIKNVFTRVLGDVFGGMGDEVLGYCIRNRM